MRKTFLTGILAASTLAVSAIVQAEPAQALVIDSTNATVEIDDFTNDIGSQFTIDFNENFINSNLNAGVSSTASVTIADIIVDAVANTTTLVLNFALTNTSTLDSRVSVLGFDTNPDVNNNDSTVSGLFDTIGSGQIANLGNIELCFKGGGGNNCSGGGSTGVDDGFTDTFMASLQFDNPLSSILLSNFGVRYQAINGTFNGDTFAGASGTGAGTPVVPTPAAVLPALFGMATAAVRKKKNAAEATQEV